MLELHSMVKFIGVRKLLAGKLALNASFGKQNLVEVGLHFWRIFGAKSLRVMTVACEVANVIDVASRMLTSAFIQGLYRCGKVLEF